MIFISSGHACDVSADTWLTSPLPDRPEVFAVALRDSLRLKLHILLLILNLRTHRQGDSGGPSGVKATSSSSVKPQPIGCTCVSNISSVAACIHVELQLPRKASNAPVERFSCSSTWRSSSSQHPSPCCPQAGSSSSSNPAWSSGYDGCPCANSSKGWAQNWY